MLQYAAIGGFALATRLIARLPPVRLAALLNRRKVREDSRVEVVADRVERVLSWSHPVLRHNCLTRGLTRYFFLRGAGADVQLVFGIGEIDGRMEGHCWVTVDAMPYEDAPDFVARFAPMWRIAPVRRAMIRC